MTFVYCFIALIIGFIICGVLFGGAILLAGIIKNSKVKWLVQLTMPIVSIIPLVILFTFQDFRYDIINMQGFKDWINWIILILTALIPAIIVRFKEITVKKGLKSILMSAFEGMAMEIPQRLFMQTFIMVLLSMWKVPNANLYSYIINALIWCLGISAQNFIVKQPFNKDFWLDIVSSFIFSIGIGYVFVRGQNIVLAMVGHALERIVSNLIKNYKLKKSLAIT